MRLNIGGEIVRGSWRDVVVRRPCVSIDIDTVMPDQVHTNAVPEGNPSHTMSPVFVVHW
jgi:hypothetical protein